MDLRKMRPIEPRRGCGIGSVIPIAAIEGNGIGDGISAADRVRCQRYCVRDQISIYSAISIASSTSLYTEVPNRAFNFRVPQQQLDRAQIACAPVNQHRLRAA